MEAIGYIYTDFPEKFGIPRQSLLVKELPGIIKFEPQYRQPEAFKGLEDFEYIWVLFLFHKIENHRFNATVKPPKLGGNKRMGVFATRSPFRPNNIGLSSVKLERIEYTKENGTILYVKGADMVNGTPILDIKPYLPYADCHPSSKAGFTETINTKILNVVIPEELQAIIPQDKISIVKEILSEDPRPGYKTGSSEEFGMSYADMNFRFRVSDNTLTVNDITKIN